MLDMNIASSCSTVHDAAQSAGQSYREVEERLGGPPDFVIAYASSLYDNHILVGTLKQHAGGIPIHGGTSCLGVMTESGFHSDEGYGMGLLGIRDDAGCFGVGAAPIGSDPQYGARQAIERALEQAGCPGEVPQLILLSSAPGQEESLVRGIEQVVGGDVPIVGGSTADNTVEGHWKQFAGGEVLEDSVVVSVLFPSGQAACAFHSGYSPTAHKGWVSGSKDRIVRGIDGRPAAQVYDEWTNGSIAEVMQQGGEVLTRTSLSPLGRMVGSVGGVPYYRLSHPAAVTPDGALTLFTEVSEGDQFVLMKGTRKSLITRAGRVIRAAVEVEALQPSEISGALVIYCAGCMLTVREDMQAVVDTLREAPRNGRSWAPSPSASRAASPAVKIATETS